MTRPHPRISSHLRVAIVGAGRMGRIRGLSAQSHPACRVVAVVDSVPAHAARLANELGCEPSTDWARIISREDVDAVVVSTPHKYLAEIAAAAVRAGKLVFCEKPGARTTAEAESILQALSPTWSKTGTIPHKRLVMGFTLRHHSAVHHAHELFLQGRIGRPMYVRGRYGHGGRPGYDQEWRADRDMAGGGELLDQGVHLIDLSRWFLGDFEEVSAMAACYVWHGRGTAPQNRLEDNAFLLLRTAQGKIASLHASWTQWKNLFSFEVYGEEGSLQISGLGGHYGPEQLIMMRRRPQGGPPEIEEIPVSSSQQSDVWSREWQEFVSIVMPSASSVQNCDSPCASAFDAWQAIRIVEGAYECLKTGTLIRLDHGSAQATSTA